MTESFSDRGEVQQREGTEGQVTVEQKQTTESEIGGQLTLSETVVAKIAGWVARGIEGIHTVGRPRFMSFRESPTRGVAAEVGEREVALDLDVVIDYGIELHQVAHELRRRVVDEVSRMGGREVVEININVVDVNVPESREKKDETETRVRVR